MRPVDLLSLSSPQSRLVVLPATLTLLGVVGPDRLGRAPSLCLIRRVFGRCPTCGVTRSVSALVRGDLSARPKRLLGAAVLLTCVGVVAADARKVVGRGA